MILGKVHCEWKIRITISIFKIVKTVYGQLQRYNTLNHNSEIANENNIGGAITMCKNKRRTTRVPLKLFHEKAIEFNVPAYKRFVDLKS